MPAIVLEDIPVKIDTTTLIKNLHLENKDELIERLEEMAQQARSIARPKAVYKEAFVDEITTDSVIIDGVSFKSRVMNSNLEKIGRVFACVFTCGMEIDEWAKGFQDMLDKFCADSIMDVILHGLGEYLYNYISSVYELGKAGWMSPGSLPDWPVTGQVQLFSVIGDVERLIGVKLTKGLMLAPVKSVSGIIFPSDINYVNCMLCTRTGCNSRRAPFNEQLYNEKLG
jgi:hypothetical protein